MIANRPDWTLSRQRQWGVPLPFFVDMDTGELHPDTPALLELAAAKVEHGGIEAWFESNHEDFGVDPAKYRKLTDTLDVWFDSGSTHETVLRHNPELRFPADLYLEGSDQHRGWFHSSLLTSSMLNGRPPYNALLTHGFVVDGSGLKMSKSKGNVVAPQKISSTYGAEILRLWVGATDYSGELFISDEILKRVVESYRRIRNTLRFLMANTADFDPAVDAVPTAELFELDRYALAVANAYFAEFADAYDKYEFHPVVQQLQTYCSEELGGFYLDILKDRLYTTPRAGRPRRSAQTALALIRDGMLRFMAPILSFTAEEAWRILYPRDATIFASMWQVPVAELDLPADFAQRWQRIVACRSDVLRALETAREAGDIGSSLQAEVDIEAPPQDYAALTSLADDLRFVMITSAVRVRPGAERAVRVRRSTHSKCERCWHYRPDVGAHAGHPALCGRCVANLFGAGEPRSFA
jgi:isoleucyl-tRNA synthetase